MKDEVVFSFTDILNIFKFYKIKILFIAFVFSIAAMCYLLSKPVFYKIKSTFKEHREISSNVKNIFSGLLQENKDSLSRVMLSKTVVKGVVENLGLQMQLKGPRLNVFNNALNNLKTECGFLLQDTERPFFSKITYNKEWPTTLFIKFKSNDSFEVFDKDKQFLTASEIKKSTCLDDVSFTLEEFKNPSLNKFYSFQVMPLVDCIEQIVKSITIDHKSSVVTISILNENRHLGAKILNNLMYSYHKYLQQEMMDLAQEQYEYLENRKRKIEEKLNAGLNTYEYYLAHNIDQIGNMTFSQELHQLFTPYKKYQAKLFDVNLEISKLQSSKSNPFIISVDTKIEGLYKDISELKRQKDALHLSLLDRNEPKALDYDFKSLEYLKDIPFSHKLHDYANNLLLIKKHALQETLFKVDNIEGLDLDEAKKLYINYHDQLDGIKLQIKEIKYAKSNLQSDVTALSLVLKDPASQNIINKATEISLEIQDKKNRTEKDICRLQQELEFQKNFLNIHIDEMLQLKKINQKLIEEKINMLQKLMINCLDSKISILNAEAKNYVKDGLNSLQLEKKLLSEKLLELQKKMQDLPKKWKMEKLLKLKTDLSLKIMQTTTQLVESNSIYNHLKQVKSHPLDEAIAPVFPKKPFLLFAVITTFILSCILMFCFYFIKSMQKGFILSLETLQSLKQSTLGFISKQLDKSFTTIKNILLEIQDKEIVLLNINQGPNYSDKLATLLGTIERKVLLVNFCGDKSLEKAKIKKNNNYDLMELTNKEFSLERLSLKSFSNFFNNLVKNYDNILICNPFEVRLIENKKLLELVDRVIITLNNETLDDVQSYLNWNNKKDRILNFISIR